jgi:hypothetical protein
MVIFRMRLRPVTLALLAVGGCATVDGAGPPSQGADVGNAADATLDSGSASDQASPPADTGPSDGGAADAARDAKADAGNDAAPTWCDTASPKPTFCADFDEGKPVDATWTRLQLDPGATAQLGVLAKSPPYSFNAVTPAIGDGQVQHALLIETLTATVASASLAFDVQLAKNYPIDPNTHLTIARIRFPVPSGTLYLLEYGTYGGQGQVVETTVPNGGQPQDVPHVCTLVAGGSWVRVQLDVTLSPTPHAKLSLDGVSQLDTAITPSAPTGIPTAEVGVDVGNAIELVNGSFDDVTLTAP